MWRCATFSPPLGLWASARAIFPHSSALSHPQRRATGLVAIRAGRRTAEAAELRLQFGDLRVVLLLVLGGLRLGNLGGLGAGIRPGVRRPVGLRGVESRHSVCVVEMFQSLTGQCKRRGARDILLFCCSQRGSVDTENFAQRARASARGCVPRLPARLVRDFRARGDRSGLSVVEILIGLEGRDLRIDLVTLCALFGKATNLRSETDPSFSGAEKRLKSQGDSDAR